MRTKLNLHKALKNHFNTGGIMKQKKLTLGLVAIGILVLTNCTKKVDYETLPEKTKDTSAALYDTKAEYLMSASQQQSSRSASDAFPFLASDNKRVKLEITEKTLRIVETEKDLRFASNETNTKLVLEIPIETQIFYFKNIIFCWFN